jgi:drug/metabolite transporter (DMT)-like permease
MALVAFTIGASHIPAAQSTLIGLLENVLAPVWVWLVVNEIPGLPTIAGGLLILATLLLHTVYNVGKSTDY